MENLAGTDQRDTLLGDINNNLLTGRGGNDRLEGDSGNDTLLGDSGDDLLAGGPGNDLLDGGQGNDQIDGGGNQDTARYLGNVTDYSFDRVSDSFVVTALNSDEGVDTLTSIERILFGDTQFTLTDTRIAFAQADSYIVGLGSTFSVDAASGVLANDVVIGDYTLTAGLVTGPAEGDLLLNTDGSFSYTPNASFDGLDSFTYSVSNGESANSRFTVTLTTGASVFIDPEGSAMCNRRRRAWTAAHWSATTMFWPLHQCRILPPRRVLRSRLWHLTRRSPLTGCSPPEATKSSSQKTTSTSFPADHPLQQGRDGNRHRLCDPGYHTRLLAPDPGRRAPADRLAGC
ncbi:Ig-like domain-containing protein [Hankyongella ginsenosidimutans]|uniref:Ig-like domain-containing protein n=1 Tax=Hankyongella ginsenosidimutans TaxID=1763828 RepID=UPI0024829197|nr:Ig-like domain-containing protein [Hankyongella ginsenosidimutans]